MSLLHSRCSSDCCISRVIEVNFLLLHWNFTWLADCCFWLWRQTFIYISGKCQRIYLRTLTVQKIVKKCMYVCVCMYKMYLSSDYQIVWSFNKNCNISSSFSTVAVKHLCLSLYWSDKICLILVSQRQLYVQLHSILRVCIYYLRFDVFMVV
jgi:hypothetical protein